MEEHLAKITSWVGKGTLRQFQNEVRADLSRAHCSAETQGDTIRFYRTRREGGFLGMGGRTTRELVMEITKKEIGVDVPRGTLDEEFVEYLASHLKPH